MAEGQPIPFQVTQEEPKENPVAPSTNGVDYSGSMSNGNGVIHQTQALPTTNGFGDMSMQQSESAVLNEPITLDQVVLLGRAVLSVGDKIRECDFDPVKNVWTYDRPVRNKRGKIKFKNGYPLLERVEVK